MLTTTITHADTRPGRFAQVDCTVELCDGFVRALLAAGVDLSTVHAEPDGSVHVDTADGTTVVADCEGDWLAATLWDRGDAASVYGGTDLGALADVIARAGGLR